MQIKYNELHKAITTKLQEHGCNAENASALADFMAMADRDGSKSHGIFRMPGYVASLKSGKVNPNASPTIKQIAPSLIHCDGDGGFAPLALWRSLPELEKLAKSQGIAGLSISDHYHFSALWVETAYLAEKGCVAFAFTSSNPFVAASGGKRAFFGTNPISFAWPRANGEPLVFDQASATLARGDIMVAAREGHDVPLGVGLDANGNDTTDPNAILEGGVQLPFGGYKGSNLALMVELLAGALVGEGFSFEVPNRDKRDGGPPVGGEFIIAIDGSKLSDDWLDRAEVLFTEMLSQEGVRLPAGRRYKQQLFTHSSGKLLLLLVYQLESGVTKALRM